MSGQVTNINPVAELDQFFTAIYKNQTGYAYSPTKNPISEEWCVHFFQWPDQKNELIQHVRNSSSTLEVYYGPALLENPKAEKEDFKGTYFVWAEFDGKLPTEEQLKHIPAPTIKVQSSESQNQHWYWQLEYFETNQEALEKLTKKLAYALEGDTGTWNCNRVLRPPATRHHESGKDTVILALNDHTVTIEEFAALPDPPKDVISHTDVDLDKVPQVIDVIAKYPWPDDDFDLFKKKYPKNLDRNVAMTRLGFVGAELGMSNEEILCILLNVDERWKKFYKRPDRVKRLVDIINYVRAKKQEQVDDNVSVGDEVRVYDFVEFLNTEINVSWVVNNLIHDKGSVLITSPPNVGKTQLCLRFAIHSAIGKDFLLWKVDSPRKILFLSLEMDHAELKYLLSHMAENLTTEEKRLLQENFLIYPLGAGVILNKKENQAQLCKMIDQYKPAGVIIDSLGVCIGGQISDDKVINELYRFVNRELRVNRDCFVWFIHHDRKAQIGNKKPDDLADVYGSQYITSHARTILHLWDDGDGSIEVKCLKLSLAPKFKTFKIRRTPELDFQIIEDDNVVEIMESMSKDVEQEPDDPDTPFNLQ